MSVVVRYATLAYPSDDNGWARGNGIPENTTRVLVNVYDFSFERIGHDSGHTNSGENTKRKSRDQSVDTFTEGSYKRCQRAKRYPGYVRLCRPIYLGQERERNRCFTNNSVCFMSRRKTHKYRIVDEIITLVNVAAQQQAVHIQKTCLTNSLVVR